MEMPSVNETATPPELTSLQQRVAREIVALVRRDNRLAGDHLREIHLAEHIGTSRSPIQAALRHLAQLGVLHQDVNRGFFLNEEDVSFKKYILDIACKGETQFYIDDLGLIKAFSFPKLKAMNADGLVEYDTNKLKLTPLGHYFIRNVCSAFDLHLLRNQSLLQQQTFSKAI